MLYCAKKIFLLHLNSCKISAKNHYHTLRNRLYGKKVQVGKDQEKAQSEKESHSKNQGGKKQTNNQVLIP